MENFLKEPDKFWSALRESERSLPFSFLTTFDTAILEVSRVPFRKRELTEFCSTPELGEGQKLTELSV